MRKTLTAMAIFALLALGAAQAEVVTFDFEDYGAEQAGNDLDDLAFGTTSTTGSELIVTMTATAIVEGTTGAFNLTSSYFGINADGSGDDTDQFDAVNGVEKMTFWFDKPGTLQTIEFAAITSTANDTGTLSFAVSGLNTNFHEGNMVSDTLTLNQDYGAGEEITFEYAAGNGFGLQQMTVDAIPEPASVGLLVIAGALLWMRRRR